MCIIQMRWLYFVLGMVMVPIFAWWFSSAYEHAARAIKCHKSLDDSDRASRSRRLAIALAVTLVLVAVIMLLPSAKKLTFQWRCLLTIFLGGLDIAILLWLMDWSPFVLGVPGAIAVILLCDCFQTIRAVTGAAGFHGVAGADTMHETLKLALTAFAIYFSAIMVSTMVSFQNLYRTALKHPEVKHLVYVGIDMLIIMTCYYWLGAGLVYMSAYPELLETP